MKYDIIKCVGLVGRVMNMCAVICFPCEFHNARFVSEWFNLNRRITQDVNQIFIAYCIKFCMSYNLYAFAR
jgi:hypothetical protein